MDQLANGPLAERMASMMVNTDVWKVAIDEWVEILTQGLQTAIQTVSGQIGQLEMSSTWKFKKLQDETQTTNLKLNVLESNINAIMEATTEILAKLKHFLTCVSTHHHFNLANTGSADNDSVIPPSMPTEVNTVPMEGVKSI